MQLNTVLLISGGAVQALQLLAALSLLILLHEFGHFFFARLFKTRVEKFYLFFDFMFPFPNVLNFALFKKKKGDTEYGLGWFPLGGYVKISGMVDESMDKDQMALPPEPWEYRSKKSWQRLLIMLGGIIVNVLVAIGIYALIFGIWGEQYLPTDAAKYGIAVDSTAERIGLKNGDKIVTVGDQKVERFDDIIPTFIKSGAKSFTVIRGGETVVVAVPDGTIRNVMKDLQKKQRTFVTPRMPFGVASINAKSEADNMGLKADDSIIAMNGLPVMFYDEFEKIKKQNVGKPLSLTVVRGAEVMTLNGTVPKSGILGFAPKLNLADYFEVKQIKYSNPFSAIGKGFTYTFVRIADYWNGLKMIFTSKEVKTSESVGGIISFGKMFPTTFDWFTFLQLTALVSIILAVMNLLPIPGLDGGYVIFLLFELVTGKKVSDKVMEKATTVGLVLLLALMLYANGLDIFRLFKS